MTRLRIRNLRIVDGTGRPPFAGDILIRDGMLEAVGPLAGQPDCETMDGAGLTAAPGFIDLHRHADLLAVRGEIGSAELPQGITTAINGNCGMSAAPCPAGVQDRLYPYLRPVLGEAPSGCFPQYSEYAARLRQTPLPLGVGGYIGCGTVRIAVKGFDPAPMTAGELATARSMVIDAMAAGAVGLSLGLMYVPECHMPAPELIALMEEAGRAGGLVSAHIRGEGASLPQSVQEVLSLARQANVPLNISHLKAASRENWGQGLCRAIQSIEQARSAGQDVTADAYPYDAGATMLQTLLPPQFQGDALHILAQPAQRDALKLLLAHPGDGWDNLALSLGWQTAVVSAVAHEENMGCVGQSIADIATQQQRDPVDCLCDILLRDDGRTAMVLHSMSAQDVRTVLRLPWTMVVSDAIYPPGGQPHPRVYGAFPRVLRWALDGLMPLEQAVRKMTALPARRAGLADRGQLRPGMRADLVLFEEASVSDRATYEQPRQTPVGILWVFIGGQAAVAQGRLLHNTLGNYTERQVPTNGF